MRHHGCKHVGLEMMKRHCKQYVMNTKSQMGRHLHGLHMGLNRKFGHGGGSQPFHHHGKFHHGHGREHLWDGRGHESQPFQHHGKFHHGHGGEHLWGGRGHESQPFHHHGKFHHGHGREHLWGRRGAGHLQSGCDHMGWGPFMQTPAHPPRESPPCNSCGPPSYGFCVPPQADAAGQRDNCKGRWRHRRGHPCHRLATSGDEGAQSGTENIPDDGQRGRAGGRRTCRRGHPCRSGDDEDHSGRENIPEYGQRVGMRLGRRSNPCRRIPPREQGGCLCEKDRVPERAHSAPPAGFTSGNEDAPGPSGAGCQTSGGCCIAACGISM